jgi:hypothetical protein
MQLTQVKHTKGLILSVYATSPLPKIYRKKLLGFLVVVILGGDSLTSQKDLLNSCLGKVIVRSCPRDSRVQQPVLSKRSRRDKFIDTKKGHQW